MVQEVSGRASANAAEPALVADATGAASVSALPGDGQARGLRQHLVDLGISAEQAANLRTLAGYLLTLPAEYPDFAMSEYVRGVDSDTIVETPECGTAACAAGHGPKAGVEALPDENWEEYAARAFASRADPWSWCFSALWSHIDNTAHGAALRIIWMLERGLPADQYEQQRGKSTLCYRAEQAA